MLATTWTWATSGVLLSAHWALVLLHPQVGEDLVGLPLEALLVCEPPAWAMDLISVAILVTD